MPKTCCPLRNQWKNQFKLNSQVKASHLRCAYVVHMICLCCASAVRMFRSLVRSCADLALGNAQNVLSFEEPMEKSIQIEFTGQSKPFTLRVCCAYDMPMLCVCCAYVPQSCAVLCRLGTRKCPKRAVL